MRNLTTCLSLLPLATAGAQMQYWQPVRSTPGSTSAVSAYDQDRDRVLWYQAGQPLQEWDGASWLATYPATTPAASFGGVPHFAYDTARHEAVLLLGGTTWLYDGSTWRSGGTGPGALDTFRNVSAWDAVRQVFVYHHVLYGQTWEWNGAQWRAAGPPIGIYPLFDLGFDPVRGQVIGFRQNYDPVTGAFLGTSVFGFDGTVWTQLTGTSVPLMPSHMGICTDPVRNRLLAYGGGDHPNESNVLWEWDGNTWQNVATGPPRADCEIARHVGSGKLILRGGTDRSSVLPTDTWGFDTQFHILEDTPQLTAMVTDPVRRRIVGISGQVYPLSQQFTWEWDGSRWLQRATHQGFGSLVYDPGHGVTVAIENDIALTMTRIWYWDGNTWQMQTSPVNPGWQPNQSICHDPVRNVLVMFWLAGTWEWNGATWTQANPTRWPPLVRIGAAQTSVFDPATGVVRLIAETASGNQEWQWDGIDWSPATTTGVPQSYFGKLVLDPASGRVVFVGSGSTTGGTWERAGNAWTLVGDTAPPTVTADPFVGILRAWTPGTWLARPSVTPWAAQYGTGCGGSSGVPRLAGVGAATHHGGNLRLDLGAAPANALVATYVSLAGSAAPLGGGCVLHIWNPVHLGTAMANAGGFASFPMPVPTDAALRSLIVSFQGVALDPGGPLLGIASLTNGVWVRIGD